MPIIQVRTTSETQWLTAPLASAPDASDVIGAWLSRSMPCEMFVYPPNYSGDITPNIWRSVSTYLLGVDPTGEQAKLLTSGKLPDQMNADDIAAELWRTAPEAFAALGATALVNEATRTALIATARDGAAAIGGVVVYAEVPELAAMRRLVPEVPLPTA